MMCFRNETFSQIQGRNQSLCCIKTATFGESIACRSMSMVCNCVSGIRRISAVVYISENKAGLVLERITQKSVLMNHFFTTVIVMNMVMVECV